MKYIFGPVPSRRLGNIIGLDIIPIKTCTFNCIYCELGKTDNQISKRAHFYDPDDIISEAQGFIRSYKGSIDYIAFTGSGEPALNSDMGYIARALKMKTKIPLALVTNSSLMSDKQVRKESMEFDVVLPSLDAFTADMMKRINRPADGFSFDEMLEGLRIFTNDFTGRVYLEVMFVKGFNDSDRDILELRRLINGMRIDKIQINTVTRLPAYSEAKPIDEQDIERIVNLIGDIADVEGVFRTTMNDEIVSAKRVLDLLKSRPMTYEGISEELDISMDDLRPIMSELQKNRTVMLENIGSEFYYSVRDKNE